MSPPSTAPPGMSPQAASMRSVISESGLLTRAPRADWL
eukprot:CAMPEP_0174749896 /NCGR_PEP_ID=MMETSP1094-20130205/96639_1 /TAXON_ID=156173 /ORGANISM="Chrysochromulina brevifilum, Strain UTEX LB 985" /LENGTH=37 /DNA_ID= /DNA_START= /DNA_END= /DNA_ORIENTATION=